MRRRSLILLVLGCSCLCGLLLQWRSSLVLNKSGAKPEQGYDTARISYQHAIPESNETQQLDPIKYQEGMTVSREHRFAKTFAPGAIIKLEGEVYFAHRNDPVIQVILEIFVKTQKLDPYTQKPLRQLSGAGSGSCEVSYDSLCSKYGMLVEMPREPGEYAFEMSLVHGRSLGIPEKCLHGSLKVARK